MFQVHDISDIFNVGAIETQNWLCVMPKQIAVWLNYSVFPGDIIAIMGVMYI